MALSTKLIFSAVVAALGGFLFGFDTVVISGAEQKFQSLWDLNDSLHGWAMSSALWGTVVGALLGSVPADRFGRKATLIWVGLFFLVSAVWSGLATDVYCFMIARFVGGLGVGVSTVAAPLYIAEIAPAEKRGFLTGLFQFNIVFGILGAFLSNSLLEGTSEDDWRWMLGIEGFPAVIYTIAALFIPESPRWLIGIQSRRNDGQAVLAEIAPEASDEEITSMADAIEAASKAEVKATGGATFPKQLRVPILLAFLVAFFNQLSGINAILYFAPRILGMAGLSDPRMGQVGIGLVNLVFTMAGLWMIDRAGRRTLLIIGSLGYIASLAIVSATFFVNEPALNVAGDALALKNAEETLQHAESEGTTGEVFTSSRRKSEDARATFLKSIARDDYQGERIGLNPSASSEDIIAAADQAAGEATELVGDGSIIVLLGIFAFIASHAIGQGAVIWVLISEVFPNEHRAIGNSIGSGTHWVFAALITLFFPTLVSYFAPGYVFAFFCFMMVMQLVWVLTSVPETKGVPLEQVERSLGISQLIAP